jgi:hypothetical protein
MLRKLLTLFALLSGLAAIGAPVTARAIDLPGIGQVASAELSPKCAQTPGKRVEDRKRPAAESGADKKPCRKASGSIVYFPPVMLRVDRSRE